MPPLRSDLSDFGPIPDYFQETSPVLVRFLFNSPDFCYWDVIIGDISGCSPNWLQMDDCTQPESII